jgi:hypothetical protein
MDFDSECLRLCLLMLFVFSFVVVFVVVAEPFCGPFDSTENLNILKQESHFNNISIRISFLSQNNG